MERARIGISACLMGECVRYDGGHKLDRHLTEILGPHFEFVPVCPEVECGLPVPRAPMHLTGDAGAPRLIVRDTGEDHTERLLDWANRRAAELHAAGLRGFIFRSRSPSCGLHDVRLHDANGAPVDAGAGLWARIFTRTFPDLPVEEDECLRDPARREAFLSRVMSTKRSARA
jgi:uncharacterized protein YbbK (DUF523 family)